MSPPVPAAVRSVAVGGRWRWWRTLWEHAVVLVLMGIGYTHIQPYTFAHLYAHIRSNSGRRIIQPWHGRIGKRFVAHQPKVVRSEETGIQAVVNPIVHHTHQADGVLAVAPHLKVGVVSAHCGTPSAILAQGHHIHATKITEEGTTLPGIVLTPSHSDTHFDVGIETVVQVPCSKRPVARPQRRVPEGGRLHVHPIRYRLAESYAEGVRHLFLSL